MPTLKPQLICSLILLALSATSYANCIAPDKPMANVPGKLYIAGKQQKAKFFAFHSTGNWCNDDGQDSGKQSIIYIPKHFIPRSIARLIKKKVIKGPINISGKLKAGPTINDQQTYQIKPTSIYLTDFGMDLLKEIETSTKSHDPKDRWDLHVAAAAAGDEDPSAFISKFPAFPNPVPTPSKRTNIELFTSEEIQSEPLSLSDAEKKLRTALKEGDYEELSYYSFDNGFAIATPLEQTDNQANPLAENRWVNDVEQSKVFNLSSFFKALFLADEGYFRVLVFIVNNNPIEFGEKVDKQTLMDVVDEGSNRLPSEITKRAFSEDMLCTALVYEFEHDENTKSIISKKPGRHSVKRHLTSTNVNQSLDL